MWNLKNKTNKTTLKDTENRWVVARGEGDEGWVKWVKGSRGTNFSYKRNKSWGCNVQA